jgi:hypothetical protein
MKIHRRDAETQRRIKRTKKLDIRSSAGGASPTLTSASSARQSEVWHNATNFVDALLNLPFFLCVSASLR